MGIDRFDYLMVGWELDIEKTIDREDWDSEILYVHDLEDRVIIHAYGEYAIYGKIIAYADDKYQGFILTELKPETLILSADEIREFREDFKKLGVGDLLDCVEEQTPKAMIFSKFS